MLQNKNPHQGHQSDQEDQGDQGDQGGKSDQGLQGHQGHQGHQGDKSDQGHQGEPSKTDDVPTDADLSQALLNASIEELPNLDFVYKKNSLYKPFPAPINQHSKNNTKFFKFNFCDVNYF